MKKIKLCLAIITMIFFTLYNNMSVYAAVCPKSIDGVHHFDAHRRVGAGYSVDLGYHDYLWGYEGGRPIYKNNCRMTEVYQYCERACIYCYAGLKGSTHSEYSSTTHSISHN